MDAPTRFVRSLTGTYYRVSEVSQIIGVSGQTIRKKMRQDDAWAPSFTAHMGKVQIYLYTPEDLDRLKELAGDYRSAKPFKGPMVGRPAKYTPDERKERNRLYTRRHYWNKRFDDAVEQGDNALAATAKQHLEEIEKGLA